MKHLTSSYFQKYGYKTLFGVGGLVRLNKMNVCQVAKQIQNSYEANAWSATIDSVLKTLR